MTPLRLASREGCEVLVAWLVEQVADLARRDSKGWTALMFSMDSGMGEARLLLDRWADSMIVNCDGQRAADIADIVSGFEEFLLMKEVDMVKVGVDKVGMVKRLLVGQAEIHKAGWTKSSLPSISSDHRRKGLC